jgi:tetratricopeptide (TPR) repeat protein
VAAAHVWLGEIAFREGRYELAQREYRQALAGKPAPDLAAAAALGYGWAALRRADLAEADRGFVRVIELGPPPLAVLARFLQGVGWLAAGRTGEALAAWDAMAGLSLPGPGLVELGFWRGVALALLGQAAPAQEALDRFLATASPQHPLRPDAMVQAAWATLARPAPDDALRRLLEVNPGARPDLRDQVHAGMARARLALGDLARARDEAARLVDAAREPFALGTIVAVADEAARRGQDAEADRLLGQLRPRELPAVVGDYVVYRRAEILERQGRAAEAQRLHVSLRDGGRVEALAQRAAYRLGLLYLQARRPTEARAEAETLLRAGVVPELREITLLLAAEGAGRGDDPNRAVTLFRTALREYPDSPRAGLARLLLGWALVMDREPDAALREWQETALGADVEVATQAYLAIAEIGLREGREPQALDALRALGRLAPAHPLTDVIALDRGILLVRARIYDEAVRDLEPLVPRLQRSPREALLRRALGLARYHLGQYELAEQQFRQAAHWTPAEPSNWLGVGLSAFHQNRLGEAEDALNRARTAATPEVGIPAAYAHVLVAAKRNDAAAFRDRATLFVDRHPALPVTGVVLYALVRQAADRGDAVEAETWVQRLLRHHPKSDYVTDALFALAEVAARDRPAVARQAYRELVARLQESGPRADARLGLAQVTMGLGAAPEAQEALEGFLKDAGPADSRIPRALALLADTHEAQGRPDQVLAVTERFLSRFPADPAAPAIQLKRGYLLLRERRWDPARQALEAARDGGEPAVAAPAHVWLGELHRERGEHEAAIEAHLGATYLYPDTSWAARGLQGAALAYIGRQMPREAAILLRKLTQHAGAEPALAQWARQALAQLGPITGEDPAQALRKGVAR